MMTTELTPAEVVAWMRRQATLLNDQADVVEEMFGIGAIAIGAQPPQPPAVTFRRINLGEVRETLARKKMRIGKLAAALKVPERALERVLDKVSWIEKSVNGWYSVTEGEEEEQDGEEEIVPA